jgi:hypothetical protein
MQTGDDKRRLLAQFENLMNGRGGEPVAEFDGVEAEVEDLVNDLSGRLAAFRIPACLRKRSSSSGRVAGNLAALPA